MFVEQPLGYQVPEQAGLDLRPRRGQSRGDVRAAHSPRKALHRHEDGFHVVERGQGRREVFRALHLTEFADGVSHRSERGLQFGQVEPLGRGHVQAKPGQQRPKIAIGGRLRQRDE